MQIAPPKSWETFEELACALFGAIWRDPLAQKNGRSGQAQCGVDVSLNPETDPTLTYGIQCKGKDALYGAKATVAEFDAELAKAENFKPKLAKWIFATTAPNDAELQKHAREVSLSRQQAGKFPVGVVGWETIHRLLNKHRDVAGQFYPGLVTSPTEKVDLLKTASHSALESIEDYLVHRGLSVSLVRREVWSRAASALSSASIVRLTGEGGAGKSAILRRLGLSFSGELLVLKDSQIAARTWQEFTASLGAAEPAAAVVERLSATGPCLLLIDGADRFLLSDRRPLIIEILKEIAESPFSDKWKIVTSARNYQGQDVVSSALKEVGLFDVGIQVPVGNLDRDEAASLGEAFPEFAEMLRREDLSGQNRTLFLLRELFQRDGAPAGLFTEMDLAGAWATKSGPEASNSANRSRALSEFGNLLIKEPGRRPNRAELDPIGLQCLIDEGTVTVEPLRDAISLAFDVHEDWLIARCLERERERIPSILAHAGEPQWWMRSIRLTGQILLEAGDYGGWVSLIKLLDDEGGLDPAWSRSLIVAPLYSEKSGTILDDLHPFLLADDASLLKKLLETLQVFESRIDDKLLTAPALAEMSETERYRLLAYFKRPQLQSWIPFLKWSLRHWESWPTECIPKLSEIARQWSFSMQQIPNGLSEMMAGICYRWLVEIEDAHHPQNWDDRRQPFDHQLPNYSDWEKVEDRLREVLTLSLKSAAPVAKTYLERLSLRKELRSPREKILDAPHQVPAALPTEWVDMCIQQFLPPRKRIRHGPGSIIPDGLFSWHEFNDAGISGKTKFFPSSPLRGGFSQLFESNASEALRLFHRLEMRAAVFWRWYTKCERRNTPHPLVLHMPWGKVPLWGDETVYRWASGLLGSNVLGSMYLALDDWLHKQLASGRSPQELVKAVLQPHGLVATVSPCIAMLNGRANQPGVLDLIGPFLAEPRLWSYDIRRHIDRSDQAYRIGFIGQNDLHFEAVREYHERHADYQPLTHAFLLPFRLLAGESAQTAFDARRSEWRADDLVEFVEEREYPDLMLEHERRIERCLSDSDPGQIEIARGDTGNQLVAVIRPPEFALPEIAELNDEQRRLSDANRLFRWVDLSRKQRSVHESMTLEAGIDFAKKLAADPLTSARSGFGSLGSIGSAAIVGTAGVAAHFGARDFVESHRAWIEETLLGGARAERSAEDQHFLFEGSLLPFDAQEFAAWGLPALASIKPYQNQIDEVVFALSVQRLNAVASAVMEGLRWDRRPEFAWSVTIAALDCCVLDVGHHWRGDKEKRAAAERMVRRRKRAVKRGMQGQRTERMPDVPPAPFKMQWIFTKSWKRPARRVLMRNRTLLDWNKAKEILDRVNWQEVASSAQRRAHFSEYLRVLVTWTRDYSEQNPDRYGAHFPFEWGHALAKYLGRFAAVTGASKEWMSLLAFTYRDRAADLIAEYLEAVTHELMVSEREPDGQFLAAWTPAADWVMENLVPRRRPTNWNQTPHAVEAAGFVGPYMTPIPPDWPHLATLLPRIDAWQQATKHLPDAAYSLLAVVERMDPTQRKLWYLPWLERFADEHGADASFWCYRGLGDRASALVKALADDPAIDGVSVRRCLAVMADAGSVVARELIPRFSKARPG